MNKKKVALICVHNSCRSQIAEALGKYLASDIFESYSAGTETKPQINQDAVRIMKEIYGIDMEANGQMLILQYPWDAMWDVLLLEGHLMITGDLMIQRGNQMMISRL